MQKIKAKIDWSGNNYCAVIENVNVMVVATHKTFEGIKKETESALAFHIEGLKQDGELPEAMHSGYELVFELQASAMLKRLDGTLTRSALAQATNIDERQLGHYIQGKREAKEATRVKLLEGIKKITDHLLSVV